MKTFEQLFHQKYCDVCREYSDTLVQSEEQEWVCPVCEEKYTCYECGAITDEASLTDGHICFDCLDLTKEDFDLEPVVKLMDDAITKLNEVKPKVFVYCPECSEPLTEDEAESVCDEGCPACRTIFDVCDYVED